MLVYKFDEKGLFVGIDETELDPLESELQGKEIYLLPPNATFDAPEEKDGFAPVWNGEKWEQVEDNRGVEYWLPEDEYGSQPRVMGKLGALPEKATFDAPEMTKEQKEAQVLAQAKQERAEAVASIVVEVDDMKFDGDEVSQGRMARSAVAMTDDETITWVLNDNSIAQVTKVQLLKALRLSGEEQTRLWTMPYEVKTNE